MTLHKLISALGAVAWNDNVDAFLSNVGVATRVAAIGLAVAQWSRQLESADQGNAALTFVRSMQTGSHNATALIATGLYKPAAAEMRALLESALYYSYFRSHLAELMTLARRTGYYIDKNDIIEFHRKHTPGFLERERRVGAVSRLETWYAEASAITHGQMPGQWAQGTGIKDIGYSASHAELATAFFEECEQVVRRILLCTVARELWVGFSATGKAALLKGLPGEQKNALGLDGA